MSDSQALRFFFERLRDMIDADAAPDAELLYNASVLAHFATTSSASTTDFPPSPVDLAQIFNLFVLDRSQHADPDILEAAASQCLLLTGFFQAQQRRRHNIEWFAAIGANFYDAAAQLSRNAARTRMLGVMATRFGFWRRQHGRLARELRDEPWLIRTA